MLSSNGFILKVDQSHVYAAFVIWHSLIVREFELALQSINPNVSVPYWDWTIDAHDNHNPYNSINSVLFSDDYFGSSGTAEDNYVVNSSRMAYFPVNDEPLALSGVWWSSPTGYLRGPDNYNPSPYVTRRRESDNTHLPSTSEFNTCLYKQNYSAFMACTWGIVGSLSDQSEIHMGVHAWTGGTWYNDSTTETSREEIIGDIYDFDTSPNDPLWFSHHANVDRLHFYWLELIGDSLATDSDPCGIYYGGEVSYPQPPGHNLWNVFEPPFYAYRTLEEIVTLGGMTVAEGCYYLQPSRCNYTYPAYEGYDDDGDDGDYDDDADDTGDVDVDSPTPQPLATGTTSPTHVRPPMPTSSPSPFSKPKSRGSSQASSEAPLDSESTGATGWSEYTQVVSAAVAGAAISMLVAITVYSALRRSDPAVTATATTVYEVVPTDEPL